MILLEFANQILIEALKDRLSEYVLPKKGGFFLEEVTRERVEKYQSQTKYKVFTGRVVGGGGVLNEYEGCSETEIALALEGGRGRCVLRRRLFCFPLFFFNLKTIKFLYFYNLIIEIISLIN